MCVAVCYANEKKTVITHFAQAKAMLLVQTKTTLNKLIPWGRRTSEVGRLPLGGWASLAAIEKGKWDYYLPKFVKISVNKFMEQDIESRSLWFDVTPGQWLQGLLLESEQEKRVYIVTLDLDILKTPYPRWPQFCSG